MNQLQSIQKTNNGLIAKLTRTALSHIVKKAIEKNWITRATRPSAWDDFWYENQSYQSITGLDVNEDSALTYSAVWACVKVISEDLGSLPLIIYRRSANGKEKERAPDHQLYPVLHDAPNPEMTAMQFRETMQSHILTWGNAYAEIERNLMGRILGLWPLNPGRMTLKRDDENNLVYEYRMDTGAPILFTRRDIFHLQGLSINGLVGLSPVGYHREAIGIGIAGQNHQATTFKSGNRLQLALVHPATRGPDPEQRKKFREEIRAEYAGATGNSIGVFWEGMKPEKIGMTNEDAQFLEGRKFTRTEIAAIYRVPPHKIMDLERATFTNIEHQALEYVIDTIRPWAVRWEQAVGQQLLDGSREYYAEHLLDGLLRGDILNRYKAYEIAIRNRILNPNECRAFENMNPYEGGDVYENPNISTTEEPPPGPTEEEDEEEAERKIRLIKGE